MNYTSSTLQVLLIRLMESRMVLSHWIIPLAFDLQGPGIELNTFLAATILRLATKDGWNGVSIGKCMYRLVISSTSWEGGVPCFFLFPRIGLSENGHTLQFWWCWRLNTTFIQWKLPFFRGVAMQNPIFRHPYGRKKNYIDRWFHGSLAHDNWVYSGL